MPRKSHDLGFMRNSRHQRVRRKVQGDTDRPRLCVFRSLKHIYAQLIDDNGGVTLMACSTTAPDVRDQIGEDMNKIAQSKLVGQILGKKAQEQGIKKVTFDRSGYRYHGRVKALAEGARDSGLQF